MVSCQEPSPLKGSKYSLQRHLHDAALVNAHSFVSMGVEARCRPCHSTAHCWHMKVPPFGIVVLAMAVALQLPSLSLLPSLSPLPLPSPIAFAVAIGHCHCSCRGPSPPPSPPRCRQPSLLPSPLPSAIAVSVTISHHSHHLCWPSPSSLLLAIAKNCCFGVARIVFKQFMQIMLTLFYFVRTVGGALIKAR
jgi:hypothetical protein